MTPSLVLPAAAGVSPVPGAEFTPDVLAKLQELEERSKEHEQALRPKNTTDGYAADWKQWEQFCALLELPVTAITPGSLTAFVEWLWWQPGWKKGTYTAPSTIDRRLSGVVVTGRTDHGLQLDRKVASRARYVLKAKVKEMEKTEETRGRGPASALLVPQLRAAVQAVPENRLGIRNRAIVLLHSPSPPASTRSPTSGCATSRRSSTAWRSTSGSPRSSPARSRCPTGPGPRPAPCARGAPGRLPPT
ncbi:hypothetical protein [Streptomyces sp. DSM 41931]|uniref:hypothetical protein n=1 Tax=Streptomyces sp. DSM 41931 TaxID=3418367 RepID=UPI003D0800A9